MADKDIFRNDAVCRGALFRYKNPRFYGFNRNFNLAVVRDEEANEYDHFDAVQDTFYDVDGETKVTWNRKLVCRGIFDRSLIYAKCRLNWIVEQVCPLKITRPSLTNDQPHLTQTMQNPEGNEGITEFESWAIDYPPLDEDYVFDSMLIYTKAAERRNGEALYQEDGITFHSHLKLYAVEPRQFSADEGRRENWEIVRHPTGRRTYRIAMCTRIFVSDGGWVLKRLVKRFDEIPEDGKSTPSDYNMQAKQRTRADNTKLFILGITRRLTGLKELNARSWIRTSTLFHYQPRRVLTREPSGMTDRAYFPYSLIARSKCDLGTLDLPLYDRR